MFPTQCNNLQSSYVFIFKFMLNDTGKYLRDNVSGETRLQHYCICTGIQFCKITVYAWKKDWKETHSGAWAHSWVSPFFTPLHCFQIFFKGPVLQLE